MSDTYAFSQIQEASSLFDDIQVSQETLSKHGVEANWGQHNLKIKVNDIEIVLSCACESDKLQWLRLLLLIIQMHKLEIDTTKVNPFTFEHFR